MPRKWSTPSVGAVIRQAREEAALSASELARRAQISQGQVSRIEAATTSKPSRNTLTALARALDRHPRLLFALAGHESVAEVRDFLSRRFREGSEVREDWSHLGKEIEGAVRTIEDPRSTLRDLQLIAAELFLAREADETLWHDAYAALATEHPDPLFEALVEAFRGCTPDRRHMLADLAEGLGELSRREELDELRKENPSYGR